MISMYQQAIRYVNQYGWSVIPVQNKVPQLKSWQEYRARLPNGGELKEWFQNQPLNGIAIVTGRLSNLSVVDVDSKTVSIAATSPIIVQTPRGRHFYFKYHEGVTNRVKVMESVDIRSEGGYVVAPGSRGYSFTNPYFSVGKLPSFPIDLLPSVSTPKTNPQGWVSTALQNLAPGNRDDTFTKIVGRLHADRYSSGDMLAFLQPHADLVGFTHGELERIINSVSKYPREDAGESQTIDAFLDDISPIEWIVPGMIAKGTLGFVAGLPETYKTWLLLDLAIECAKGGGKWLGRYDVGQARVLFVDQERFKGETQRRLKSLLSAKNLDRKHLRDSLFVRCGSTTRLDLDESFRAFKAELQRIKPDMVLIDSFATFNTRNENDRKEIQMVIERIKELRSEIGCTFIFIDHESKAIYNDKENNTAPSAFGMVGSVGKSAAAEFVFTVRRYDPQTCMVYNTKNSLAPCVESFPVTVQDMPKGIIVGSEAV